MQVSEILSLALKELNRHVESGGHPESLMRRLNECIQETETLQKRLQEIQEFVLLDVSMGEQSPTNLDTLSVDELLDASKLINLIHRSGVDVTDRSVFSSSEIEIARRIIEQFESFSAPLAAFRAAKVARREGQFVIHASGGIQIFPFVDALESIDAIEVTFIQVLKEEVWKPFKRKWAANATASQEFRIFYKPVDKKVCHFVGGDWMTAFVGDVIRDHLSRNEIDYELFTKLEYKTPHELGRDHSDLDVIVLHAQKKVAYCFECKSGSVKDFTASEIVFKGRHIKDVLERHSTEIEEVHLLVVYDHHVNDEAAVQKLFQGTGTIPIRLNQLRELVHDWR